MKNQIIAALGLRYLCFSLDQFTVRTEENPWLFGVGFNSIDPDEVSEKYKL